MNTEGQEHDGKRKIKWATMIPLIGGSAIGCKKATGVYPQYHLSYSAFKKNETHLKRYWPEVPWLYLDENSQTYDFSGEQIDFVNSVCPCAGLSMLNVSKKGQVMNIFVNHGCVQRYFIYSLLEVPTLFKTIGC